MVVSTEQRGGEDLACLLELRDVLVQCRQPSRRDRFPLRDLRGVQDAVDVVERKPGVLQHADEHQASQRFDRVATLTGRPRIGDQQAATLVVADGRGGDTGPGRDLPDGEQRFAHADT
jgi:hypothetical protein